MENKTVDEITSEVELCHYIDSLLEEAKEYRQPKEKDWREYERFYDGKHWRTSEERPKINWLFSIVEYETPIITDSRQGSDVVSIEDERDDDAKVLKEAVDYVYYCNHLDLRTSQGVREALKATNHYLYVDYDPDRNAGEGDIVLKNLNWRNVYLDPSAGDLDDMAYCVIRLPTKVEMLKKLFPLKAEDIEPEMIDLEDQDSEDMYRDEHKYHPPKTGLSTTSYSPHDMAYLIECWHKDYSMEPIPEEETQEQIQNEINQIMQGGRPEVERYLDHQAILEALQPIHEQLSAQSQMIHQQKMEAAQVGPQIVDQAIGERIQSGAIQDPEEALNAQDELHAGLAEQVLTPTDEEVSAQVLGDVIAEHQLMLEKNPQGMKPKYLNNIRLSIKVQSTILYDGPPPVELDKFPIAPIYCYKEEGKPYSTGEIKNALDAQKMFNELNYDEHKNLRLNANSGWVLDDNCGVDEQTLVNEPGLIIRKKAGTELRRLEPGQVSPQLASTKQFYRQYIEEISGITEVTQGKRPTGVTAASAITALQEQAIGRIRLKERMLSEYTMPRLGQIVSAFIIHYWDKQKILKVYDDNGRIKSVVFDPARMQDLKYQVRVVPGTTFGVSKESIFNQSTQMLQAGVLDPMTFLTINKNILPFAKTAMEQLQARDQLMQQAQALQMENEQLKQLLGQVQGQPQNGAANGTSQANQSPIRAVS